MAPFTNTPWAFRGIGNFVVFVLLVIGFMVWQAMAPPEPPAGPSNTGHPQSPPVEAPEHPSSPKTLPSPQQPPVETPSEKPAGTVTIPDLTIRDEEGRVAYRGTVDLTPTLDRIEQGKRLRFSNDGSTFQNREGRLPRKSGGYYHEYVHPTQGLGGPGPQRIVIGSDGEIYYTPDHYKTFRKVERAK